MLIFVSSHCKVLFSKHPAVAEWVYIVLKWAAIHSQTGLVGYGSGSLDYNYSLKLKSP